MCVTFFPSGFRFDLYNKQQRCVEAKHYGNANQQHSINAQGYWWKGTQHLKDQTTSIR